MRFKYSHIWHVGAILSRVFLTRSYCFCTYIFWYIKLFQPHFVLFMLWPQYQPFFQGVPVSFSEELYLKIKICVLVYSLVLDWHCFCALLVNRARKCMYTYCHTHIHVYTCLHIHIHIYISKSIYQKTWVHTVFLTPVQHSRLPPHFISNSLS